MVPVGNGTENGIGIRGTPAMDKSGKGLYLDSLFRGARLFGNAATEALGAGTVGSLRELGGAIVVNR